MNPISYLTDKSLSSERLMRKRAGTPEAKELSYKFRGAESTLSNIYGYKAHVSRTNCKAINKALEKAGVEPLQQIDMTSHTFGGDGIDDAFSCVQRTISQIEDQNIKKKYAHEFASLGLQRRKPAEKEVFITQLGNIAKKALAVVEKLRTEPISPKEINAYVRFVKAFPLAKLGFPL